MIWNYFHLSRVILFSKSKNRREKSKRKKHLGLIEVWPSGCFYKGITYMQITDGTSIPFPSQIADINIFYGPLPLSCKGRMYCVSFDELKRQNYITQGNNLRLQDAGRSLQISWNRPLSHIKQLTRNTDNESMNFMNGNKPRWSPSSSRGQLSPTEDTLPDMTRHWSVHQKMSALIRRC